MEPQSNNQFSPGVQAPVHQPPPVDQMGSSLGIAETLPDMAAQPLSSQAFVTAPTKKRRSLRVVSGIVGLSVLVVLVVIGGLLALRFKRHPAQLQASDFNTVQLPLATLESSIIAQTGGAGQAVTINGQLVANNSVVLTPTVQPSTGVPGQLYYDSGSNQLNYYNGSNFVGLGGGSLTNIQNQNTTVINNSTTTINGANNAVTGSGTAGRVPKFTGSQTVGDSLISDDGTIVTVFSNLNLINPNPGPQLTGWDDNTVPAVVDFADPMAVELGVKFQTDVSGVILGVRFYKGPTNTGTHIGNLWTSAGVSLASATFTGESASGWQTVTFAHPVAISANTTYVASYHTNVGEYAADSNYFTTSGHDNAPLHMLQNGADGDNGIFRYSATSIFPTNSPGNGANYWVDVVFRADSSPYYFEINGAPISSGNLSNNYDIAKRSSGQVFTGINTFRNSVNSDAAFVIQNASSSPLLVADTAANLIAITTLNVSGDLTLSGHILSTGLTPGIAGGPAACTTPTVFMSGTDITGMIDVTTGTACPGTGKLATITFNKPFSVAPRVLLTPANANAAGLTVYVDSSTISATTFDLQVAAGTITDSTDYRWYYQIAQ